MPHINVEIKARCTQKNQLKIGSLLASRGARHVGLDHQIDTYFITSRGRLKIRQGNIENALIYYERQNTPTPKKSKVYISEIPPEEVPRLREILTRSQGVWLEVKKQRDIYVLDNLKFHLDRVKNLGSFLEIEAKYSSGLQSIRSLRQQCEYYMDLFEIRQEDLIPFSYSDMLMQKTK